MRLPLRRRKKSLAARLLILAKLTPWGKILVVAVPVIGWVLDRRSKKFHQGVVKVRKPVIATGQAGVSAARLRSPRVDRLCRTAGRGVARVQASRAVRRESRRPSIPTSTDLRDGSAASPELLKQDISAQPAGKRS